MRTLVLNADYSPLKAISWKRAIQLAFLGKISVVKEYQKEVSSPSLTLKIPAVVALKEYRKVRFKKRVKFSTRALCARDRWTCQYCGTPCSPGNLTKDHVIPRDHFKRGKVKNGLRPTSWQNIVLACKPCNSRKDNRTPEEAGMALLTVPREPKVLPLLYFNPPEEWVDFLR